MSVPVNTEAPLVVALMERAMLQLRATLYDLSDTSFPGLRSRHYRLLSLIPADGERLSRIAVTSGLTKQALAQALAPLEDGGYVEVVPDPHDRRARVLRLTDRGRAANAAVRAALAEVEAGWADRVGPERYATARSVLTEIGSQTASGAR